jgi:hypothetical protein
MYHRAAIQFAEKQCLAERGRFCLFDELHLDDNRDIGPITILSPSRATIGEYDIALVVHRGTYCLAGIPRIRATTWNAYWWDASEREYLIKHPWKEIPEACRQGR